jgi:hypothetical protein
VRLNQALAFSERSRACPSTQSSAVRKCARRLFVDGGELERRLVDGQLQDRASDSSQAVDGDSGANLVLSSFFCLDVRDRIRDQLLRLRRNRTFSEHAFAKGSEGLGQPRRFRCSTNSRVACG